MVKLTDYFLVAMPGVTDPVFSKSVVYVTEHDVANGAVGVIINKPLQKTLKDAFKNLDIGSYNLEWENSPLYLGGPLSSDNGFVLHRTGQTDEKLFELTNDRKVLDLIAASQYKDQLFVSVGYVAWADYQIENEIVANNWLIVKSDPELIFDVDAINRYDEALKLLGIKSPANLYCSNTTANA